MRALTPAHAGTKNGTRRDRTRWRAPLLSALVFPGLGQLANRCWGRAALFAAASGALLVVLFRRVAQETLARLPDDPVALADPALPLRLAAEIQRDNASFFLWVTAGLVLAWALSIAEAWRTAAARSLNAAPPVPRFDRTPSPEGGLMAVPRYCSNCAAPLPAPPPVTCPACDTSHWLDSKPCAGALVARDGRVLLVKRAHDPWRDHWDVPGGFCGPGEHPRDAAARELREETGLTAQVGSILGIWMDTYAAEGRDLDKSTLNVYYHATVDSTAQTQADPNEVAEIGWFAPEALPEPLAFPGHVPAVLDAWRDSLPGAARRTQTRPAPARARESSSL